MLFSPHHTTFNHHGFTANTAHFPNFGNLSLIALTQWQYWWWFWFTLLLCLYFAITVRLVTNRTLSMHPKIVTSYRSHGRWGDMLICFIPVFWCLNILTNSHFLLRHLEWQTENSMFTLRVRGKQWYWVYKFDLDTNTNLENHQIIVGSGKKVTIVNSTPEQWNLLKETNSSTYTRRDRLEDPFSKINTNVSRLINPNLYNYLKQNRTPFLSSEMALSRSITWTGLNWLDSPNATVKPLNDLILKLKKICADNSSSNKPNSAGQTASPYGLPNDPNTSPEEKLERFTTLMHKYNTLVWVTPATRTYLSKKLGVRGVLVHLLNKRWLTSPAGCQPVQLRFVRGYTDLNVAKNIVNYVKKGTWEWWTMRQQNTALVQRYINAENPMENMYTWALLRTWIIRSLKGVGPSFPVEWPDTHTASDLYMQLFRKVYLDIYTIRHHDWLSEIDRRQLYLNVYITDLIRNLTAVKQQDDNTFTYPEIVRGIITKKLKKILLGLIVPKSYPAPLKKRLLTPVIHTTFLMQTLNKGATSNNVVTVLSDYIYNGTSLSYLKRLSCFSSGNLNSKIRLYRPVAARLHTFVCSQWEVVQRRLVENLPKRHPITVQITSYKLLYTLLSKAGAGKGEYPVIDYLVKMLAYQVKLLQYLQPDSGEVGEYACRDGECGLVVTATPTVTPDGQLKTVLTADIRTSVRPLPDLKKWFKLVKCFNRYSELRQRLGRRNEKPFNLTKGTESIVITKEDHYYKVHELLGLNNLSEEAQDALLPSHLYLPSENNLITYPLVMQNAQQFAFFKKHPEVFSLRAEFKTLLHKWTLTFLLGLSNRVNGGGSHRPDDVISPLVDETWVPGYVNQFWSRARDPRFRDYTPASAIRAVDCNKVIKSNLAWFWLNQASKDEDTNVISKPLVKNRWLKNNLNATGLVQLYRVDKVATLNQNVLKMRLTSTEQQLRDLNKNVSITFIQKKNEPVVYTSGLQKNKITSLTDLKGVIVESIKTGTRRLLRLREDKERLHTWSKKQSYRRELTQNKRLLWVTKQIVLPTKTPITVITNSYDVIHSWFLPGLGLKMDCVPGRSTHHTMYIDRPGYYYGQCAEVCGRRHHHMPIKVLVTPFTHFLYWWNNKVRVKALDLLTR